MFATKDISDVNNARKCCSQYDPACDYCPYFDELDFMDCIQLLENDISYYLKQYEKLQMPTEEEQPYLPGMEKTFDLSSVKFKTGDYLMLDGVKYTYDRGDDCISTWKGFSA